MGELFVWWLAIELVGVAGLPCAALLFANLPDRGWALTKPLSLILFGWLVWFPLAAIPALPYAPGWIVGTFLVFFAGNVALVLRVAHIRATLRHLLTHERMYIAASEILFVGAYALMAWVHSFTPAVVDTEKFMDVAFLSSLWRTPHLPAPDPWLSGAPINYYYFGHFLLATLAKVLGTQPGTTFNIGIALIFALTAAAVFGVAANLVAVARRRVWPSLARGVPYGLASVLLVLVAGNLNAAQVWWQQALADTGRGQLLTNPWQWWLHRDLWLSYNWWNPSRVIPNTINEFPAFSFVLADLHAHILALPFAALAVGIAFNLLLARGEGLRAFGHGPLGLLVLLASAVAVGGLYAINGWDLPTYLGLALLALAIQQYLAHDRRINALLLLDLFAVAALLIALCFLTYLPFYRGFVSPSQGIAIVPAEQRTPVGYEFAIFGLPVFLLGSLIIWRVARWAGAALASTSAEALASDEVAPGALWDWLAGRAQWVGSVLAAGVLGLLLLWTAVSPANTGFTLFWCLLFILLCAALALRHLGILGAHKVRRSGIEGSVPATEGGISGGLEAGDSRHSDELDFHAYAELWIFCIVGTVAALIAAAEIVYLRDIFGSRMNTVFKLYFQSWLLLGICSGPALAWLLPELRRQFTSLLPSLVAPLTTQSERVSPTHIPGMIAFAGGASGSGVGRIPLQSRVRNTLAAKAEYDSAAGSTAASVKPASEAIPSLTAESFQPADSLAEYGAANSGGRDEGGVEHAESAAERPRVEALGPEIRTPLPLILRSLRAGGILIWMGMLAALVCAVLVYPVLATSARTANFSLPRSLDGTAYMATDSTAAAVGCAGGAGAGTNAHDNEAIAWLNTHISGSPVIVEAPGCEWSHYSRISAFTGLPTIMGWPGGHEGEWRVNWLATVSPNDPFGGRYFGLRADAVNRIYTDPKSSDVVALLKQYNVRLVYVGAAERQLYATADLSRFGTFLRRIYAHDGITIYEVPW